MKLKILAASFVIGLSVVTYKVATYNPVMEIVDQLRAGKPVTLDSGKVYDFTGFKDIPVTAPFNLNYATIKCDSMLQIGFNDNHYLFQVSSGSILNGTIQGASGRNYAIKEGYFGAVQVVTKCKIKDVKFKNCDKWAIRVHGDRWSNLDTTYITNCTFDSIPRDGSGYGTWNQYGVVVMDSCKFNYLRHAFDAGSEANSTFIYNSEFRNCFYIPIHQHRYIGDSVGIGLTVKHCKFYDTYMPFDIGVPFSGQNTIDSNYFAGSWIGKTGRDTIPIGTNSMNGKGLIQPPNIIGKTIYQAGEKMTLRVNETAEWNNGVVSKQTTTTFAFPMVRVYSAHVGGLSDTITVVALGSGNYTSFRVMAHCPVEVWSGEKRIASYPKGKLYDYRFLYYPDTVRIRLMGKAIGVDRSTFNVADGFRSLRIRTELGTAHLDNFLQSGFYDTFEEGVKVKIRYFEGYVEVWR